MYDQQSGTTTVRLVLYRLWLCWEERGVKKLEFDNLMVYGWPVTLRDFIQGVYAGLCACF